MTNRVSVQATLASIKELLADMKVHRENAETAEEAALVAQTDSETARDLA